MPGIRIRTAALLAAIAMFCLSPSTSTQVRRGRFDIEVVNNRETVAREVLIKLRDPFQTSQLGQILSDADAETVERIGRGRIVRLGSRSRSTAALLAALARRPDVEYAEPNFIVHALTEPNDRGLPFLWGLRNLGQAVNGGPAGTPGADIEALDAWNISTGSNANVVAVVDTGIDYNHEDLAPNIWSAPVAFTVTIGGVPITCPAGTHGFNAIERTCDPMDDHNHGTHVSGTIGALGNNAVGVVGVNWTASIMGLKFLSANGSGTIADAVDAMEFGLQAKQAFIGTNGANIRVLSNSWGGGGFSQAMLDEVNAANADQMLFVAAAGNSAFSNDILPAYPASYDAPNVVAVAATTNTDDRAYFSNYGAHSVHLGAPGMDVLSTVRGNAYAYFSGTSMAAPHVSGAAALVLSRCDLDTATLKETLLSSVDPVAALATTTITGGRLNVSTAIRSCVAPPATPSGVTARGGDALVKLAWASAPGATSYRVKRSLTSGGPYAVLATNVKGNQYTDNGLVNGTTYYYVVSAANMLGESGDSTEASAIPKTPPDLIISNFLAPGTAGAGATISVSVATKNQGAGAAGPSTTRFYVSDNTIVDAADVRLDQVQNVPGLAPGIEVSATVALVMPANLSAGMHYLIAKADAGDVLFESQEANNTRVWLIFAGPDLILPTFTVPTAVAPGTMFVATDTVKNQGPDPAAASTVRFYWSTNSTLDAGDTVIGSRDVPALGPGTTSSGQTTLPVPATATLGTYYVIAEADGPKQVAETNEYNNTALRSVQIGADLLVSAFSAPSKLGAGVPFIVTDTTTNQGGVTAPASVTQFYLSTDAVLSSNDTLLDGNHAVPALAANESSSSPTTVTVPSGLAAGSYYLIAKADGMGTVTEAQETNNTAIKLVALGPDLIVYGFSATYYMKAGSAAAVSDTTTNQGGGDAAVSTTRFYLSTNYTLDAGDVLLPEFRSVPPLAAGASSSGPTSVTIPAGTAPGSYVILAKSDADGAVVETSESNNVSARVIQVSQ